jgi:hypothetical protein
MMNACVSSFMTSPRSDVTRSRGFYHDAITSIRAAEPDKAAEIAEQYFVMGYSEMLLAELFCNGTPLGETINGEFTLGKPLTNQEVFAIALVHLDSALSAVTVAGNVRRGHAARGEHPQRSIDRQGRGGEHGRFSDAATAAGRVGPTTPP